LSRSRVSGEIIRQTVGELCKNANIGSTYWGEYRLLLRQRESVIGEGTFGKVYSMTNDSKEPASVLKIIEPTEAYPESENLEIKALWNLTRKKVKGISEIFDCYYKNKSIAIIMKRFHSTSLSMYIKVTPDSKNYLQIMKTTRDLAEVLENIHTAEVFHNDIKPDNIVRVSKDSYELAFVDFGLATDFQPGNRSGTIGYISAEFLYDNKMDRRKNDTFGLGISMVIIINGSIGNFQRNAIQIWEDKHEPKSAYVNSINKFSDEILEKIGKHSERQCGKESSDKFIKALKATISEDIPGKEVRITLKQLIEDCEDAYKSCEGYRIQESQKENLKSQDKAEAEKPYFAKEEIFEKKEESSGGFEKIEESSGGDTQTRFPKYEKEIDFTAIEAKSESVRNSFAEFSPKFQILQKENDQIVQEKDKKIKRLMLSI
jgi:serine/threonine protein kinase